MNDNNKAFIRKGGTKKIGKSAIHLFLILFISFHSFGQALSDVFPDLQYFKNTFPIDDSGDDYEGVLYANRENPKIKATERDNLVDWTPTGEYAKYLFLDGNELVFKAHCAGALTSPNAYPRSELRETPNGTDDLWSMNDEHELNATFKITHLPVQKKEVCALQIKGNSTNSTSGTDEPFRLDYRDGSTQGLHLTINEDETVNDVMDYALNQTIVARMYVNEGKITIELDNIDVTGDRGEYDTTFTSDYAYGYFKVGCYTQSSIWGEKNGVADEEPDAYGEVRFSQIILGAINTTAINSHILLDDVDISPNPTKGDIYIKNYQGATLSIFNINGTLASSFDIIEDHQKIDIKNLTPGLYVLQLSGDKGTTVKRLVKH